MNRKIAVLLLSLAMLTSLIFIIVEIAPRVEAPTTWYVDDSNPGPGDGSPGDPFQTIQAGVDNATPGGTGSTPEPNAGGRSPSDIASYLSENPDRLFDMPKDEFIEEVLGDPDKRARLYTWILTAQIVSVGLIVVGGIVFILWALGVI